LLSDCADRNFIPPAGNVVAGSITVLATKEVCTFTVFALDTVTPPELSVARAVSV
jgi:hypothetical protein